MLINVLVTGAAGYLGSILCEHLLAAGYRVTALDSLLYNQPSLFHLMSNPNFDFYQGDVRQTDLMKKMLKEADVVIPLAAIVGAGACAKDPWAATTTNLEAIKLINRLRSPDQLVVYPTTNSGYGTKSGEVYCTEESSLEPVSLYGQ